MKECRGRKEKGVRKGWKENAGRKGKIGMGVKGVDDNRIQAFQDGVFLISMRLSDGCFCSPIHTQSPVSCQCRLLVLYRLSV